MKKRWWKSKTLWLNTAVAVGTVVEANFGLLQAKLGAQSYLAAAGLVAGANFLLRFLTTQPITGKDAAPK
jgi:hypothetical protein